MGGDDSEDFGAFDKAQTPTRSSAGHDSVGLEAMVFTRCEDDENFGTFGGASAGVGEDTGMGSQTVMPEPPDGGQTLAHLTQLWWAQPAIGVEDDHVRGDDDENFGVFDAAQHQFRWWD